MIWSVLAEFLGASGISHVLDIPAAEHRLSALGTFHTLVRSLRNFVATNRALSGIATDARRVHPDPAKPFILRGLNVDYLRKEQ
jgi:hypothetical protein